MKSCECETCKGTSGVSLEQCQWAKDDKLVKVSPLLEMVHDCLEFLSLTVSERIEELRRHGHTGRPLGNEGFVERLEGKVGRVLRIQ